MTALTSGEKTLLRAGGHKATLYLSVLKPQAVFTARVNGAYDRGARAIVYDGDTGEDDVLAGMTLWVGTSAGACDVGKVRVRAIDTDDNTLTVSENSLVWADDQYLTVKRVFELWPVFPRFDTSGDFYKDYDVPYTDENEQLKPVATLGPPQAAFDGGSATTFTFIDTGAGYAFGGESISSRSWDVVGPGSYAWTPGANTVLEISGANRFTDAHWVTLTVTDSNGKTQTTRRPVFCHERTGANAPITAFTLESLSGDWERGGWSARLRVYSGATASDFPDGTLIVLWQEVGYGATTTPIGGNYSLAKNVLFAGYVRGESVRQDWTGAGEVSFEATTIDGLLRRSMMFSVPLKMILETQDQWYEFTGPTVAEAVHHYWRWHSTLFDIADVYLPTANTLRAETIEDFAKGDLYSQADNFARNYGIFAHACCNKIGQVYVAEDAQMLDDTDRAALAVVSDITAADRREEITIQCQPEPRVGMVHLSGFAYTRTPLISKAPGDAPEDIGAQVAHVERQILESQAQANTLAGRVLAAANNPYPEVRVKFAGHYLGALDIVPQEWWTVSLAAGDTPRGIVWTDQRLVCRNVSANYDPAAGSILADAVFEPEAEGTDGVDGDYPTDPPDDDDITPPSPPVPPTPPPLASGRLATFDHNLGHLNQTSGGVWEARNEGATTIADNQGGFDPHWPDTQASTDLEDAILWRVQAGKIYRSLDCGRNWAAVTGMGNPPNDWSDDPAPTFANCDVVMRTENIHRAGEHYFLVRWQNGDDDWRGWILKCTGNGTAWMWEAIGEAGLPSGGADYYYLNAEVSYSAGSQAGGYTLTASYRDDILGSDTDDSAALTGNQDGGGQTPMVWAFDMGGVVSGVNDIQYYRSWNNFLYLETDVEYSLNGTDWTAWGSTVISYSGSTGWASVSPGLPGTPDFRYIRFSFEQANNVFHNEQNLNLAAIRVYATGGFVGAASSPYGIWMDADTADGAYLYLTACDDDDALTIQKRLTSDLSLVSETSLGTATIAEIAAGTYAAYPRVREFDPATVFVHGRLPGITHLQRSTDGGASFSEVTNDFEDADTIGFFIVGHDGVLWAVENTGGAPILWRDTGAGFEAMPAVPLTGDVRPDNMTIIPNTAMMAMASDAAVVRTEDAGATWADQDYPTGGDIRSLLFIA